MRRVGAVDLAQLSTTPAVPDAAHTRLFAKPDGRPYTRVPGGGIVLAGSVSELEPVRVRSTGNVTISGTQTIDGVALAVGDRVLLTEQTTTSQNGVWVVQTGAWTRPTDYATGSAQPKGLTCTVMEGAFSPLHRYTLTAAITVDTSATVWRVLTFVDVENSFGVPASQGDGHMYHNLNERVLKVRASGVWYSANGVIVCTSTTRPTVPGASMIIYETDTGFAYIHDGTTWQPLGSGASGGGGGAAPCGTVTLWPTNTAPAGGYLICNGGTFQSTVWPELAAVLGDTYGTHAGTTYYLPDFRGRSPIGVGTTVPATGGNNYNLALKWGDERLQTHAHSGTTGDQDRNHSHTWNMSTNQYGGGIAGGGVTFAGSTAITHYNYNYTTGADTGHLHPFTTGNHDRATAEMGNVHPVLAMNYIIKATGTGTGAVGGGTYTAVVPALTAGTWANLVHSLGTESVGAWIKETVTKENVGVDWKVVDSNTIAVRSHSAVAANFLTAVVKA